MIYGMVLFEEDAGDFIGGVMYGMVVFEEEVDVVAGTCAWGVLLEHRESWR